MQYHGTVFSQFFLLFSKFYYSRIYIESHFVTFNLAPSKIAFNLDHWMCLNLYKKCSMELHCTVTHYNFFFYDFSLFSVNFNFLLFFLSLFLSLYDISRLSLLSFSLSLYCRFYFSFKDFTKVCRASQNFNSTLFYHPKKSLYHYTISFYNISNIPNFYLPILLIKIIYLHNKIIYPKIQIKTKTQITTCYHHHHEQPSTHHRSQIHQQPQHWSNSSPIQTHQPNKPSAPIKKTHHDTKNLATAPQNPPQHQTNLATAPRKKTQPPPSKPTTTPVSNHKEKPTKKPPSILLLLI